MSGVDVTVVVPARDAAATIPATLDALAAQDFAGTFEVFVVDSGSRDDTPGIAAAAPVVTALLRNPGGEPAGSRNLGARQGSGRVIAFTDADCAPEPGWLTAGVAAIDAGADLVQGTVLPIEEAFDYDRTLAVTSEYGLYETANILVRRDTFTTLGGFERVVALDTGEVVSGEATGALATGTDTRPFGEDVLFGWRVRRSGARTAFSDDAIVRHAVFRRGAREWVAERARDRYFPPLVALVPELRDAFLYRRVFLSPDSARFDLALAGLALTVATRRAVPLVALVPYGALVAQRAGGRPRRALAQVAADAVGAWALARGSWHTRTPVL